MTQVLRGNIIQAPRLGELDIREHGYLVLEDGVVQGIYEALPQALASAPITDYGDRLIMQSFVDMHLHAPQYPMLGMGMDLPLLDWLNTYTSAPRPGSQTRTLPAGPIAAWPPT